MTLNLDLIIALPVTSDVGNLSSEFERCIIRFFVTLSYDRARL